MILHYGDYTKVRALFHTPLKDSGVLKCLIMVTSFKSQKQITAAFAFNTYLLPMCFKSDTLSLSNILLFHIFTHYRFNFSDNTK